jgi:rhamnogalacturonyl hydrolase YesR
MRATFQQYVEDEAEEEEEPAPLTRRKTPGGNYHDVRYERTMTVDTSLMTGNRSYKKARKATELQKYYDSFAHDFVEAEGKEDSPLFKDPLTWWLLTG